MIKLKQPEVGGTHSCFNDSKEAKQAKKISYYSPFKSTNNWSTGRGG